MPDRFKIEPHAGMWESSPEPGNTFYHVTAWWDDGGNRGGPTGFLIQAPPTATPEELEALARVKWAEQRRNQMAGLRT